MYEDACGFGFGKNQNPLIDRGISLYANAFAFPHGSQMHGNPQPFIWIFALRPEIHVDSAVCIYRRIRIRAFVQAVSMST